MRTSSRRTQLFTLKDFTGGLNLTADTFRLADNESPDLLNVDIDRRGGFQVRSGIQPYSTSALSAHPDLLWQFRTSAGVDYLLAQVGSQIMRSTGTTWTQVGTSLGSSTATVCATTFNNRTYWVRGDAAPCRWDGSTATTLTSAFNDSTSPSSGNMPKAEHVAAHSGYLFVAGTYESGTAYPNRIRWSWANTFDNSGENWRTDDYIDFNDGKEAEGITAIVPFRDHLVVFKENSVYAIYGYSSETFSVVPISNSLGAINHECALNTPAGLFFFDRNNGLNVWDGTKTTWVFEQIWPAMRDRDIPVSLQGNIRMGWVRNRLWLSVPWLGQETVPRFYTFVFDPFMQRGGGWTRYDLQAGPYLRGGRTEDYYAALWGTSRIYKLDVPTQWFDDFGSTLGTKTINAYLRTRWVDLDQPAIKKRWRRMEAVLQVGTPYELPVESYSNFDYSIPKKNFKFSARVSGATGTESRWNVAKWQGTASGVPVGNMIWAIDSDRHGEVDRGSNLGVARAVSVKVGGQIVSHPSAGSPQAPVFWGVDSLIFKFVPRRVR